MPNIPELRELREGFFEFWFRSSEVTMIGGQSGDQKSGFALFLAAKFAVPTLYFSADSGAHIVSSRLAAALTGEPTKAILEAFRTSPEQAEAYYQDVLSECPIKFCYDSDPTYETIEHEVTAWVEANDSYPALIVVDNLMDLVAAGDSEHAANKDKLLLLKSIARSTGACVIVLHHMTDAVKATTPPPRSAIMGKVSQTPDNVLSIALDYDKFMVSAVKHRTGPSSKDGAQYETFYIDPARNRFAPWATRPNRPQYGGAEWTPSGMGE